MEGMEYDTSPIHTNGCITVFGVGEFGVEDFSKPLEDKEDQRENNIL